jgi:hypothetical protein
MAGAEGRDGTEFRRFPKRGEAAFQSGNHGKNEKKQVIKPEKLLRINNMTLKTNLERT